MIKTPVFGMRRFPRRIFWIPCGTRNVRFVERYEDRVVEGATTIGGHRSPVTTLSFSPDGALLASGSRDRTLRVWNADKGCEMTTALEVRAGILAAAFIPGHSAVVAVLDDRRLVIWNYGSRRQAVFVDPPDHSRLEAVAVSADGRWIAAGGGGRSAFVWPADLGGPPALHEGLCGQVAAISFVGPQHDLVCATRNARLFRVVRGSTKPIWSIRMGSGRPTAMTVLSGTRRVVAASTGGSLGSWDVADGRELSITKPVARKSGAAAFSRDASQALLGLGDGTARLVGMDGGIEAARLEGHHGPVTTVALSPNLARAATGGSDGSIRLWGNKKHKPPS